MARALYSKAITARDLFTVLPTGIVGVTAVCFSIGLLIVNVQLGRHGVFSSDLVRSEYVLAGALFLFLTVGTALTGSYVKRQAKGGVEQSAEGHVLAGSWTIVRAIALLFLAVMSALVILSDFRLRFDDWRLWVAILVTLTTTRFAWEVVSLARSIWESAVDRAAAHDKSDDVEALTRQMAWTVPTMLLHLAMYSMFVYPNLSPAYGGGHKPDIVIILTAEGMAASARLGLPVKGNGAAIGPVRLLMASDNEVVVALPYEGAELFRGLDFLPGPTIRLSRGIIQAMASMNGATPATRAPDNTEGSETAL